MTRLGDQLRSLADAGHKRGGELRASAGDYEAKHAGFFASPQTVAAPDYLAAFGKAKRLLEAYGGEPAR